MKATRWSRSHTPSLLASADQRKEKQGTMPVQTTEMSLSPCTRSALCSQIQIKPTTQRIQRERNLAVKGQADTDLFLHTAATGKTFWTTGGIWIWFESHDTEELPLDLFVVTKAWWLCKKCLYFLEMQSEIFGRGMLWGLGWALEYFWKMKQKCEKSTCSTCSIFVDVNIIIRNKNSKFQAGKYATGIPASLRLTAWPHRKSQKM